MKNAVCDHQYQNVDRRNRHYNCKKCNRAIMAHDYVKLLERRIGQIHAIAEEHEAGSLEEETFRKTILSISASNHPGAPS